MQPELTAPPVTTPPAPAPTGARRALVSSTLGSIVEWFDFAVYGALAATVFPVLFFNRLDPAVGILASFATFGVGFAARPLGGLFFGYLGDRLGRRRVLMSTFIIMGVASLGIGLLPTYAAIGLASPVLLVALRFVQGFALGGEATGAQLMAMEHAPPRRRAFYGAMIGMGSPLSQVLANLLLTVLTLSMTSATFLSWGWRIPFLLSIALVGIGIYVRLTLEETPIFKNVNERAADHARPLAVLKSHPVTILRLMLAYAPIVVTFYVVTVFGISYLTSTVKFGTSQTFSIVMVANLFAVGAIWIGGRVADVIGRRKVLLWGSAVCLASGILFFPIVHTHNFVLAMLIAIIAVGGAQFGNAAQPALFAEAFPTRMRFTGVALASTGSTVVFGATAPFVASSLMTSAGGTWPIAVLWVGITVIAMVNVLLMNEGPSLEGTPQTFR
jgi:MFS family permease